MIYKYMNMYTGELYKSVPHMLKTIIFDMIHFKGCRTLKMFHVKHGRY